MEDSVSILPDGSQGRYQQPSPQGADQLRGRWSWLMTDIHWSWAKVVLVQRRPDFPAISSYFQLWLGEDGPMVPTSVKSLCRKIASRPKWWFCNWLFVSGDFTREEPELESGGGYHLQRCGCDLWHWSFKKSGNSFVVSHSWGKITQVLVPSFLLVRDRFKHIKGSPENNSQTLGWGTALVEVYLKGSEKNVLQVSTVLARLARQNSKKPILEIVVQILALYSTSSTSFSEFKLQPMVVLQEVRWELWSLWRVSHTNAQWEALGVWIQVG